MASIASIEKRADGKWRVRYRDPEGRERSKHFERKVDAVIFRDHVRSDVITGRYVDPMAGQQLFGEYAAEWAERRAHRPSTAAQLKSHLDRHVLPYFGARPIGSIRRSELEAWMKGRSQVLAPSTTKTIATWVSTIFRSAVDDGLIVTSPFHKIALPKTEPAQVVPLDTEQVLALVTAMPERYQAAVICAAGTGLRQGELLGLTIDRVDFLARRLRVDRQLLGGIVGEPLFGPPKTKASYRSIPLPEVVLEALAEHLRCFTPSADGLVFRTDGGAPVTRNRWGESWRPAAAKLGLPPRTGLHALRHYYASLLIRHGESVKTVQLRLGHASAVETLNTYSHLWPDSEDRTRSAVDDALRARADSERTGTSAHLP